LFTVLLQIPHNEETFEADWAADCEGTGQCDQNRFEKSLYQMIDHWCTTSEEEERVQLLQTYHAIVFCQDEVAVKQMGQTDKEKLDANLKKLRKEWNWKKKEWDRSCVVMAEVEAKRAERSVTEQEARKKEDQAKLNAEAEAKRGSAARAQSETEERARREAAERARREAEELELRATKEQLMGASNAAASNPFELLREAEERWRMATSEIEQRIREDRRRREAHERELREGEERRRQTVDEEVTGRMHTLAGTRQEARAARAAEAATQEEGEERMRMLHEDMVSMAGGAPDDEYWREQLASAEEAMRREAREMTAAAERRASVAVDAEYSQRAEDSAHRGRGGHSQGRGGRSQHNSQHVHEYATVGTQTLREDIVHTDEDADGSVGGGEAATDKAAGESDGATKSLVQSVPCTAAKMSSARAGVSGATKMSSARAGVSGATKMSSARAGVSGAGGTIDEGAGEGAGEGAATATLGLSDRDRHLDRSLLSRPPLLMSAGREGAERWVPLLPLMPPPSFARVVPDTTSTISNGVPDTTVVPGAVARTPNFCSRLNLDFYDLRVLRPVSGGGNGAPLQHPRRQGLGTGGHQNRAHQNSATASTSTTSLTVGGGHIGSAAVGSAPSSHPPLRPRPAPAAKGSKRLDADAILRAMGRQQRKRSGRSQGPSLDPLNHLTHAMGTTEGYRLHHDTPAVDALRHQHHAVVPMTRVPVIVPARPQQGQCKTRNSAPRMARLARPKHVHGAATDWKHQKRALVAAFAPPPTKCNAQRLR
jgi:hypothetical protein